MKVKIDKALRLSNDLVAFCAAKGASDFQIHLNQQKTETSITITAPAPLITPEDVDYLSQTLNLPRQHEVEQNYWEITSDLEVTDDLTLVGIMIDTATVEYEDGVLHIHVWRGE